MSEGRRLNEATKLADEYADEYVRNESIHAIAAALREAERRGFAAGQERMRARCLKECEMGPLLEIIEVVRALPLEDATDA